MKMNEEKLAALVLKHLTATLTPEEKTELNTWRGLSVENEALFRKLTDRNGLIRKLADYKQLETPVTEKVGISRIISIRKYRWWAAASILLISILSWIWVNKQAQQTNTQLAVERTDIPPGTNGALLTLANGQTILLDSMVNGTVATEDGINVNLNNGELVYDGSENTSNSLALNKLVVPKGRQFKLVLPDGSKVWLNAASSIEYPVTFNKEHRAVRITGEAYFEVTPEPTRPFLVNYNKADRVEVLGTHFNINAYKENKETATTLLEGKVKVSSGSHGSDVILAPGQQALAGENLRVLNNINLDKVIAWKNGLFNFEGANLREVLDQIGRWYDLEIVYEGKIPDMQFGGKITRDLPLSRVLYFLNVTGVSLTVEDGKRLIVKS